MSISGNFDASDGKVICPLCKKEICDNTAVDYHGSIVHDVCAEARDNERKRILDKLGSRRLEDGGS